MLFYSVAHYYDVNNTKRKTEKYNHILKHIEAFKKIEQKEKEFILVSFVDTPMGHIHYKNVKIHLEEFCNKNLPDFKSNVIIEYNWGGTIAALWYTYLFLKSNNQEDTCFIAHFEEDFGPINENFYKDSIKQLTNDIIYVGESSIGRIKKACPETGQNDDGRLLFAQPGCSRLALPEVWTDGGYYFSNLYKLKEIEKKIGIFHKGNQNTKYNNNEDGISLGEVGFPTLLYHADFKFRCLNRSEYFINEWCGGH